MNKVNKIIREFLYIDERISDSMKNRNKNFIMEDIVLQQRSKSVNNKYKNTNSYSVITFIKNIR